MGYTDEVTNGATTNGHTADGLPKEAFVDGDVAISPNAPAEVPALLKRIAASGDANSVLQDEKVRTDLLDTARSLVYALETPREAIIRHCWSQVCPFGVILALKIRANV